MVQVMLALLVVSIPTIARTQEIELPRSGRYLSQSLASNTSNNNNSPETTNQKSSVPFSPLHRPGPGKPPFEPPEEVREYTPLRVSPSVSIITPSAYGLAWEDIAIGIGFQERTRFTNSADGAVGLGVGFGDPQEVVGLQLGVTITDLWDDADNSNDSFGGGNISLKMHRQLTEGLRVAVGWQKVVSWGASDTDSGVYGVLTQKFIFEEDSSKPFSRLDVSLGVGGGPFRLADDVENQRDSVGVFGSVALRTIESLNFISEWTGQDLSLGLSWAPIPDVPLIIVPAVTDVTGTAGDGARFIFGIGYGFYF